MSAAPDFRLYHGNDLEALAALLAEQLRAPGPAADPLEPEWVLVPQPAMKRWLQATLAARHGVAANLAFLAPGEFVARALQANPPALDAMLAPALEPEALLWRLWALLAEPALAAEPVFAPLRALLDGPSGAGTGAAPGRIDDDRALRAFALARSLAGAFEKYQAWRRDWLLRWDAGADRDDWQAELWRRATRGRAHRARALQDYLTRFGPPDGDRPAGLPSRLFAFACLHGSPDVLRVIASQARVGTLHFFFPSPVRGWWGDLETVRERLARGEPPTAEGEHPLLASCGAAGRDVVRLLFEHEAVQPSSEFPVAVDFDAPRRRAGQGPLLRRLRADLDARRPSSMAFAAPDPADRSLRVHACHTRLREVQVLHDRLRDMLERDPALQPRDIAVLAPDIDAYAPMVRAVFGGAAGTPRFIPWTLADTSPLAAEPLAGLLLTLLALPAARFGAAEVLDLLALPAVARAQGLDEDALARLRAWLPAAGVRWGLDAAHRARLGAPAEPSYTWAWALDRLLLGMATGDDAEVGGVVPWPHLEGQGLAALDALLRVLRVLARLERACASARPLADWQALLQWALQALLPEQPEAPADQRALARLDQVLADALEAAAAAGLAERPVPAAVLRAHLEAVLGEADQKAPLLSGGVAFGRMVPMRLLPFRVIALLGMDDGAFPRRDPAGGPNRLAEALVRGERRVGDRSLRDDDRFLFLQLLASADDALHISYLGQDPRSGEPLPPSTLVDELLELACACYPDPAAARALLHQRHPLQPFSPAAFAGEAGSFAAEWHPAARRSDGERAAPPPFATSAWTPACAAGSAPPPSSPSPQDAAEAGPLPLAALRRALLRPHETWLREGLGLWLEEADPALAEAEPFSLDGLQRHALQARVLEALEHALAGGERVDADALQRRLLAEAVLPPGPAGAALLADARGQVDALARQLEAWRTAQGVDAPTPLALRVDTADGAVAGVLEAWPEGVLQVRLGGIDGRQRVRAAIDAVALAAAGDPRPVWLFSSAADAPLRVQAGAPAQARADLAALLRLRARLLQGPPPCGPKAALAFLDALAAGLGDADDAALAAALDDPARRAAALRALRAAFAPEQGVGEGDDPWVAQALRGRDPAADPAAVLAWALALATPLGLRPGAAGEGGDD